MANKSSTPETYTPVMVRIPDDAYALLEEMRWVVRLNRTRAIEMLIRTAAPVIIAREQKRKAQATGAS